MYQARWCVHCKDENDTPQSQSPEGNLRVYLEAVGDLLYDCVGMQKKTAFKELSLVERRTVMKQNQCVRVDVRPEEYKDHSWAQKAVVDTPHSIQGSPHGGQEP